MNAANQMEKANTVYVPISCASLQNATSWPGISLPKDVMMRLPEDKIIFLDLSQGNTLSFVDNDIDNDSNSQTPFDESENVIVQPTIASINSTNYITKIQEVEQSIPKQQKSKDGEMIKCNLCGETFTKGINYKRHMDFHKNMKKYKCKYCSESYNVEDNFKLHMAIHSRTPVCPLCNRRFQRFASLRSHLLMHQVDEAFTCKECLAEFDKETDYNKHLAKHIEKEQLPQKDILPYTCTYCNYVFVDSKEYKDHVSYHIKMRKLVYNSKRTRKSTAGNKDLPYKCTTCGKSFIKSCLLDRHLRIHSGEKPFACTKCDKTFSQKGTLQIHLLKHTGFKPYKCSLCPASFFQKGNLRVHVERTHTVPQGATKVYKCTQCTCVFRKSAPLNAHVTKAHSGAIKIDEITEVTEQLKALQELAAPRKPEEKGPAYAVVRTEIGNKQESQSKRQEIERRRTDEKREENEENENRRLEDGKKRDNLCDKSKTTETIVKLSSCSIDGAMRQYIVKQKKVGNSKSYICSYCNREIKKPSDLFRHIRTHTREKPFQCTICHQSFTLKSTLLSHLNTHVGKKEYQCLTCLKLFSSMKSLKTHSSIHDYTEVQVLKYKCSSCNKLFSKLSSVRRHMQIHNVNNEIPPSMKKDTVSMKQPLLETTEGLVDLPLPRQLALFSNDQAEERPYMCHVCNAAFMKTTNLKRHMRSHSGEKNHICDVCGKCFGTIEYLKTHSQTHSQEKKFQCNVCPLKFSSRYILKRHLARHTTAKNYVCPYCKKKFKTADLCRKHINIHKNQVESLEIRLDPLDVRETLVDNVFDLKAVQNANSLLTQALKINSEEISKTEEELEKLGAISCPNRRANVLQAVGNKQKSYLITLPDGTQLQNFHIDPDLQESNQFSSTLYISYNDMQQVQSDAYDSLTSQVKMKSIDPILSESQAVNILFMDPLAQQNDFHDSQTFDTLNQSIFSNAIAAADLSLTTSNLNIPLIIPNLNSKTDEQNLLPSATLQHNKFVLDPENQKLTLPDVDSENIVVTLQGDQLKAGDLAYFPNMSFGLSAEEDNLNTGVGNLNLIVTDNVLVSGNAAEHCISCAVCKTICGSIEELAKHQCVAVVENDGGELNEREEQVSALTSQQNLLDIDADFGKQLPPSNLKLPKSTTSLDAESFDFVELNVETAVADKPKKQKVPMVCGYCNKLFKKLSDLQRHLRIHTGEKPYKCEKCTKCFSLKSTLQSHLRTHDPSESKKITCTVCNSNYSCGSALRTHMLIHTGARPYACSLCPSKFRTSAHRKSHVEMHARGGYKKKTTIKSDIKNAMNYANNYFESLLTEGTGIDNVNDVNNVELGTGSEDVLLESVVEADNSTAIDPNDTLTMTDALPIDLLQQLQNSGLLLPDNAGNILGQSLMQFDIDSIPENNNQSLLIQNLSHDQIDDVEMCEAQSLLKPKKFECTICGKMYSSNSVLRKHQKIHKKFRCTKCGKEFSTEEELERHSKIHLGYRPFSCTHCANSFSEVASLKTHMKRIHNLASSS